MEEEEEQKQKGKEVEKKTMREKGKRKDKEEDEKESGVEKLLNAILEKKEQSVQSTSCKYHTRMKTKETKIQISPRSGRQMTLKGNLINGKWLLLYSGETNSFQRLCCCLTRALTHTPPKAAKTHHISLNKDTFH